LATHKSARKRARQDIKRRARNRHQRGRVKGAVKNARAAVVAGDAEQAGEALCVAEGVLRRAASKGAIPKKRASREISRLAKHTNRLGS
jgi:small subunit ribosomal protein S20